MLAYAALSEPGAVFPGDGLPGYRPGTRYTTRVASWCVAGLREKAIAIMVIVVIVGIFVFAEVGFNHSSWAGKPVEVVTNATTNATAMVEPTAYASDWTSRGFKIGLSLCFAVFGAEVFNLAFWQRVFMAKDDRALRSAWALAQGSSSSSLSSLALLGCC